MVRLLRLRGNRNRSTNGRLDGVAAAGRSAAVGKLKASTNRSPNPAVGSTVCCAQLSSRLLSPS